MFQVDDYVVDSANGVCKVESIVKLDYMPDKNKQYFLLVPIREAKSKIYIPVDSADERVRKVLTEGEIKELMSEIGDIDPTWIDNDKERERGFKEAVKSCEPKQLVGMIKSLYFYREKRKQEGKKNTAVEEKYFKQAEENLYSEIGFVMKLNKEEVKKMISENTVEK